MATTVYRDPRLEREPTPRFEVERFACHMEKRLGNGAMWHNSPNAFLIRTLHENLGELMVAVMDPRLVGGDNANSETVRRWLHEQCADVANVAMMMFDNSIEGREL